MKYLLVSICMLLLVWACMKGPESSQPDGKPKLVFADSIYQLTGVAVSKIGRVFVCYPRWSNVYQYAVAEVTNNTKVPYPNAAMNQWQQGEDGQNKWVCVQAVFIDRNDMLWVVDPASPFMKGVYQNSHKLVKIDLASNSVVKVYSLAGVADANSYINDVRIDESGQYAYLTNSSEGGIVVVNLADGKARQVLQQSNSVHTDSSYHFIVDGRELYKDGKIYKTQSDGIALSNDRQYLYYKALTDNRLFRIKTQWLKDETLTPAQLNAKAEDLGRFTTSDGMIFDEHDNLYLGDIEHYRIVRIRPDMQLQEVRTDSAFIWPDSYSIDRNNQLLYISCSQIQKQPDFNNGVNRRTSPYAVYRILLPR